MSVRQNDWNGEGYVVRGQYADGEKVSYEDQEWVYDRSSDGNVPPPVEYRQSLERTVNGLTDRGFQIVSLLDSLDIYPDPEALPGSWDHHVAFFPPWFSILTKLEN
jgi:hypothetical protein